MEVSPSMYDRLKKYRLTPDRRVPVTGAFHILSIRLLSPKGKCTSLSVSSIMRFTYHVCILKCDMRFTVTVCAFVIESINQLRRWHTYVANKSFCAYFQIMNLGVMTLNMMLWTWDTQTFNGEKCFLLILNPDFSMSKKLYDLEKNNCQPAEKSR